MDWITTEINELLTTVPATATRFHLHCHGRVYPLQSRTIRNLMFDEFIAQKYFLSTVFLPAKIKTERLTIEATNGQQREANNRYLDNRNQGFKDPHLRGVCLDGVVDVDEDEEECDQHRHPPGDHLGVDQEADPGDAHEEAGGEVVGDDVKAHLAREDQLEARRGVVHPQRHVVRVLRPQRLEGDPGQHRIRANVLQIHNLD